MKKYLGIMLAASVLIAASGCRLRMPRTPPHRPRERNPSPKVLKYPSFHRTP